MELERLFDRAVEVAAAPAAGAIKQRLAQTATELNLAGHMEAHLGIATSAIAALISVLYATEADGRPANYDSATYRILLRPLPWGESGAARWQLRRWEGQCLRRLLIDRVGQRRRLPGLFDYNEFSRQWHVNAIDYPNAESALDWLRRDGPRIEEWRTIVSDYRAQAHARMRRLRG